MKPSIFYRIATTASIVKQLTVLTIKTDLNRKFKGKRVLKRPQRAPHLTLGFRKSQNLGRKSEEQQDDQIQFLTRFARQHHGHDDTR